MSDKKTYPKKVKSISIEPLSALSIKKTNILPPIASPSLKYSEENDDEEFREETFSKKKNTIQAFMKKNDLKMINMNAQETKKNLNLIRKNASIQVVNLSKKMFENALDIKKDKGSIMVNELWSHNYYKKVMKYSNLKQLMDNILKYRRTKLKENKQNTLKKNSIDFHKEMDLTH